MIYKNHFNIDDLPDVFSFDVSRDEDICSSRYISRVSIPIFNMKKTGCDNIEMGIMKNGYNKAL